MHPSSNLSHGNAALVFPRAGASLVLLLLGCLVTIIVARALPDMIGQIARPCSGCYLGAFVPPLEPYGRPFRQSEATGAADRIQPAVVAARPSSTPDAAWHWLAPHDADQTSLFGSRPVSQTAATLFAPNDVPVERAFHVKYSDPAYALAPGGFQPAIAGERSVWNTAPDWFSSTKRFAPASTSGIDMSLVGSSDSAIASWATGAPRIDPRPADFMAGRDRGGVSAIGVGDTPSVQGSTPYWRVALRKDLERHFIQVGTYGTDSDASTGGNHTAGAANMFSNVGAEVGYHYLVNRGGAVSDTLSVHATLIHEARSLGASHPVLGSGGFDSRNTFLADASWNIGETVVPSIQYFQTAAAADAMRYSWPGGRGNSAGVIAGVAYVPWSGDNSPIQFLNLRFAAHYVAHSDLGGSARGAGSGNAMLLSLWGALRF